MKDIIESVRISEATFFNYFPTKDALLREFAVDTVDQYAALLGHELRERARSVADRIREVMRVLAAVFSEDRQFMTVVVTRSNIFYGAADRIRRKELRSYELLTTLLLEGQSAGEFRRDCDPQQAAEILTATYMLTIVNWLTGWWKKSQTLEVRLLKAVDVVLDGLLPARQSPKAAQFSKRSSVRRRRRLRLGRGSR